jgi:hypothetical protein
MNDPHFMERYMPLTFFYLLWTSATRGRGWPEGGRDGATLRGYWLAGC